MMRRLYDWMLALAAHRHARPALAVVSFLESSVFPIPPDVMLIPMVLADRARAWVLAALCTVASVAGGALGYLIGYVLWDSVGQPILDFYGYGERFGAFQEQYHAWGAWIVFFAGVTPFPYKVITIASGVAELDPLVFMVASLVARGVRFFAVAGLLYAFGEPIRNFIEKNLGLVGIVFFVSLFGGFLAIKYLL